MREGVADFCYPFLFVFPSMFLQSKLLLQQQFKKTYHYEEENFISSFLLISNHCNGSNQSCFLSFCSKTNELHAAATVWKQSFPDAYFNSKSKYEYSARDKASRAEFPSYSCLLCRFKTPPEAYQNKGEPSLNLFFSSSVFKRSLRT